MEDLVLVEGGAKWKKVAEFFDIDTDAIEDLISSDGKDETIAAQSVSSSVHDMVDILSPHAQFIVSLDRRTSTVARKAKLLQGPFRKGIDLLAVLSNWKRRIGKQDLRFFFAPGLCIVVDLELVCCELLFVGRAKVHQHGRIVSRKRG